MTIDNKIYNLTNQVLILISCMKDTNNKVQFKYLKEQVDYLERCVSDLEKEIKK